MPGEALDTPAPSGPVTILDVRPLLARGEEPFTTIMDAVEALPADGTLELRSTFEPVPLHGVLGAQGFRHEATEVGPNDWTTRYWRG